MISKPGQTPEPEGPRWEDRLRAGEASASRDKGRAGGMKDKKQRSGKKDKNRGPRKPDDVT